MEKWLSEVNRILLRKIGISVHDLADFDIYNTWRDGASPAEGAYRALEFDDMGILDELEAEVGDVLAWLSS